jgi:hypothetical protein
MSIRVLEFPVSGSARGVVLVEVDDLQDLGARSAGRGMAEKARQSLESALSEVMPGVNALIGRLQELDSEPDEFGLEFGIKFTADAGALIARTSVEGNIKVSIKWTGRGNVAGR